MGASPSKGSGVPLKAVSSLKVEKKETGRERKRERERERERLRVRKERREQKTSESKKRRKTLPPLFSPDRPARGPRGLPLEVRGPAGADRGHQPQRLSPRRGGPGASSSAAGGKGVGGGEPVAEEEVEHGEPSLPGGAGEGDDLFDKED